MVLDFRVTNQKLELHSESYIVSDTYDYLSAKFRFTGDWAGLLKTASFKQGDSIYESDLVDDEIAETEHLNLSAGTWTVSVIGYELDGETLVKRITTDPLDITVVQAGYESGDPFPDTAGTILGFVKLDQTTPQTIIGGVPKLAEDRVISDDHHIVDKAYVDGSHPDHNDLGGLQGGDVGEYYHMTQAQNAALHSHDNKTDLDSVSGVNTGDQDLSSYAKSEDLHTHANKTDLDKVSGTNTGDQTLPTRDSLGLDTDDTVTFANLSGMNTGDQTRDSLGLGIDDTVTFANLSGMNTGDQNAAGVANTPAGNISATTVQAAINELDTEKEAVANKVTSLSDASTDTQYPSAKCIYNAIAAQRAEKYTAVWDKVNAQCTRANSAAGITTTITNFCHRGTVNASRSNPFDSIYPWSAIGVCNISIDLYRALASGGDIRDCIVSWLGDPDFDYNHVNGVWVYTPEFWYTVQDIGTSRHFTISPFEQPGYIFSPKKIEGRWFGGVYTLTIDSVSKTCLIPKPGMPGKSVALSTLHTYAKNWGASIENIYGYSATDVLMIVEFATMNTQTAIGNGVSDLYRQSSDTIQSEETASATVKVLTAAAENCIAGSIFDIGTTNGSASVGSYIIASTALDTDPTYTVVTLTTDGSTPASVTATTANFWSIHGLSNTVDASIGAASGYIGTNGKCHAYYRGQVAHANLFRYILGVYRQTATGKIWIANSSAEADGYDALDTGVHKDTGLTLPQGAAGVAIGDYIGSLHLCPDVPAAPFCETIGGSSGNPVGDYCSVPTLATANTVLVAGGRAYSVAFCGRFCGYWGYSAASSHWSYGAVPVLKTPI